LMTSRAAVAIVAFGLTTVSGQARQAAPSGQTPTFHGGTALVHLDVVVADAATGRPVTGLLAKDFTLRDDTGPQSIASFDEVHFGDPPPPVAYAVDVPRDVGDNATAVGTELVGIVVDDLHIADVLTPPTRDALDRLLAGLGRRASLAL